MSNNKKIIPDLRFSEFKNEEEWNKDIVDNLVFTITPPKKLSSSNYQENGKFPIIDQSKNYYCGWTNDNEAIITNDLPLIIFGDHTCIIKIAKEPFAQGADGIKILKAKNKIFPEYLFHYLKHNEVVMEDYKRHYSILKDKVVVYPNIDSGEQQKIADCLSSSDEVIAAHSQKLELLKEHKKGLMQNLFPQKGEKVPKLRFPEFVKEGEWKIEILGKLSKEITEKTKGRKYKLMSITSGYGLVSQIKKFGREIAGNSYDNYYVIKNCDFAYNKSSTKLFTEGEIAMFEDEEIGAVPNSIFTCFRFDQNIIYPFFAKYPFVNNLHGKWLRKFIAVGARANGALQVNSKDLFSIPFAFPSLKEQQKIAFCLSSLDALITAQAEKIEQLKLHKKGLMQGLFPKNS